MEFRIQEQEASIKKAATFQDLTVVKKYENLLNIFILNSDY